MTGPSYIDEGFDPDDGLDETTGRWMWDDEHNVQRWVRTDGGVRDVA